MTSLTLAKIVMRSSMIDCDLNKLRNGTPSPTLFNLTDFDLFGALGWRHPQSRMPLSQRSCGMLVKHRQIAILP